MFGSDMQAFKAANPGCVFGDFIRWYSPNDWTWEDTDADAAKVVPTSETGSVCSSFCVNVSVVASTVSLVRILVAVALTGSISVRMQDPANIWQQLWRVRLSLFFHV